MTLIDIYKDLENNSYPGRGIVFGKSQDGKKAIFAYFIMGRSENSRNRIFVLQGNDMKTKAFDESKLTDPSLIIYNPVRELGNKLIITNGDQTDTIFDYLADDKTFEEALKTRTFEPDMPNCTPRISGVAAFDENNFSYKLSILKADKNNENHPQKFFFEYENPISGQGHFIHTYKCDGSPIPSFEGEPKNISLANVCDIEEFSNNLWNSLNEENKVSLFVRFVDLETGKSETEIINKNN
ncbi:MAG: IMP cyclohydrolase [Oscillospiraceae bacterium]